MFALFLIAAFILADVGSLVCAENPPLTAETIMARVAANQDRSNTLRSEYVYHQHIHAVSRKANGKLMCEETVDYLMIPTPKGTKKEQKLLTGRYWHKGHYIQFHVKLSHHDIPIDCALADSLGSGLTNGSSKDGLDKDLFPLTTSEQTNYQFWLVGKEIQEGRTVYDIGFKPREKDEFTWAGEAYIDATDFQPVDVFTKLSRRIPFVIRTLLVALPGVGFNVQYQRQPGGVWFPASFGTEFRIRVTPFFKRDITISLENTNFEQTHVQTHIQYVGPK
ncbi:MAG: hypothetical protein ACRD18_08370 [Terriglobia bacterium]